MTRTKWRWLGLGLGLGALTGCGPRPLEFERFEEPAYDAPAEWCVAPDVDAPERFPGCSAGSGVFGSWDVDPFGLPAYVYRLDQNADPRAEWTQSDGRARRDHWFALGNERVNVLAYNDGPVEVVTQDRGVEYLNKYDERWGNFAGGFGYLDDGEETWSTAYKWRPTGAKTSRRYGMGYADTELTYRGLQARRVVASPPGDAPVVVAEVELTNLSNVSRAVRHYEYWDVGRRNIEIDWVVSGSLSPEIPQARAAARDARNRMFIERVEWDAGAGVLGLRRSHASDAAPPPRGEPNAIDFYPGDPFLAVLRGPADDVYTEQEPFFGDGGPGAPAAVTTRSRGQGAHSGLKGAPRRGTAQRRMFGVRSDLTLAPGETKRLRFAYGYAPMGEPYPVDPAWKPLEVDVRARYLEALRPKLMYFATPSAPFLQRELAWHAYQMQTSVGRREYWNTRVVPQGSAYLYLHGADGAARDLGLFALPLVYTDPALARDELRLYMQVTHAKDRRFSYAFQGHGMLDDALGVHAKPSDLTLFFLWGLTEYLGATGDVSLLEEKVPFWPKEAEPDATGWDHLVGAVRHLFDVVGTGPHGHIRVQSGDWNDGVLLEAPNRDLALRDGESVLNTQMAYQVLPRVADWVEGKDPALAQEIRSKLPGYCAAIQGAWTGQQFGRVYYGDGVLRHATWLNLEAQTWPLLTDCWVNPGDRELLAEQVHQKVDLPSPTGAPSWPGGQVWPAISSLLTWGYARHFPERAFAHLQRSTLTAHAQHFPELWYGIWSGPDALNGVSGSDAGKTWSSVVTPMTDFPVMNNNAHAMPQFAALRVAGLEATAQGLRVQPRVPDRTFALRTQLVDLDQRPGALWGTYRPLAARRLEVVAPDGERVRQARLNGAVVPTAPDATSVVFEVGASSEGSRFELETGP